MSQDEFRLLTPEEFARLYERDMRRDFPPDELKPFARLRKLTDEGLYEPYGLFRDGKLLSYAHYWKAGEDPYVMLDYFAVMPEARNAGVGSALLRDMLGRFCQNGRGVFGEVEVPNTGEEAVDDLRRRRLGFYARAGLRRMDYTTRIFGVPYLVLVYGPEISEEALMETHRKLYRSVFSDEVYAEKVVIPEARL